MFTFSAHFDVPRLGYFRKLVLLPFFFCFTKKLTLVTFLIFVISLVLSIAEKSLQLSSAHFPNEYVKKKIRKKITIGNLEFSPTVCTVGFLPFCPEMMAIYCAVANFSLQPKYFLQSVVDYFAEFSACWKHCE
jgi:hypothetical protein